MTKRIARMSSIEEKKSGRRALGQRVVGIQDLKEDKLKGIEKLLTLLSRRNVAPGE